MHVATRTDVLARFINFPRSLDRKLDVGRLGNRQELSIRIVEQDGKILLVFGLQQRFDGDNQSLCGLHVVFAWRFCCHRRNRVC